MNRVLWDAVPADVQAELELRTDVKPKGIAIITRNDGKERWYFRKEQFGWNNISVDRDANASETAPDLTDEQRAQAKAQVDKVAKALAERMPSVKTLPRYENSNGRTPAEEQEYQNRLADPLYCPAHTDHRHNLINGRCACNAPAVPEFDYSTEPQVLIEIRVEVDRPVVGILGRRGLGYKGMTDRREYMKIKLSADIAMRDNWLNVRSFRMHCSHSLGKTIYEGTVMEVRQTGGFEAEVEAEILSSQQHP